MRARVGDRLHVHGNTVGEPDRIGEIVEVRGTDGGPPYLVRFPNGHGLQRGESGEPSEHGTEKLIFPGPDAVVEAGPGR